MDSIAGWGTKTPQHVWRGQKKKKKINSVFKMKSTFMNFLLPEDI